MKIKYLLMAIFTVFCFIGYNMAYAKMTDNKYKTDPVFVPLYEGAPHPLAEMLEMAENGDVRAQYIIADLYLKGKGGFAQDANKAKYWFEKAAKQKNLNAFVRLAAIAKRQGNLIEAYSWYISALKYGKRKNKKLVKYIKSQKKYLEKNNLKKEDIKQAKKIAKAWIKSNNPVKYVQQKEMYNR